MAAEHGAGTQAVERAMSLLACFTDETSELRISELCAQTNLGQSTVSRMVSSLDRMGFLAQDARTGLYRLGPTVVTLGSVALNSSSIFRAARQIAQNLAHVADLGANLAEFRDDQLFYLGNFEGSKSPKSFTMAGRTAPLHATGMGKTFLSAQPAEYVREFYAKGLGIAYTPHTITELSAMESALAEARSRGYATEIEELAFGRACVAAPIRGRGGDVVAALSVSGPLSELDDPQRLRELALMVVEAADEVSVALGFTMARAPQPRVPMG
ncbi:IclR family transcriptional regulator [Streptomyces sp. YC504]|uniref:Glycerol operon regulatory protein n=1 Tax=Streptomyces mesophilus TaxID=1775132 RepID=A0A6G4XGJ9_9ACTN|nr:IclR family transcriptional regulator [Streptomyces mesophilus]NGO76528.1 IclR family transcriptional regulator [Streptomyces mesophilus]